MYADNTQIGFNFSHNKSNKAIALINSARWLSANAFGLRSRGPGFESWRGYGCLVAFFMCYRDGSSRLDTIV